MLYSPVSIHRGQGTSYRYVRPISPALFFSHGALSENQTQKNAFLGRCECDSSGGKCAAHLTTGQTVLDGWGEVRAGHLGNVIKLVENAASSEQLRGMSDISKLVVSTER